MGLKQFPATLAYQNDRVGTGISHAIWADNIYLFAESLGELNNMFAETSRALAEAKLYWKDEELYILASNMYPMKPCIPPSMGMNPPRYMRFTPSSCNVRGNAAFHGKG